MVEEHTRGFVTGSLTAPLKRRDARASYREFASQHPSVRFPLVPLRLVMTDIGWVFSGFGALGMLTVLGGALVDREPGWVTTALVTGVLGSLILVIGVAMFRSSIRLRPRLDTVTRHARFLRFARDNGMTYDPTPQGPRDLKPLRGRGSLTLTRVMRPISHPSVVQFANYEVVLGHSRSRYAQFGGLCAIRLPRPLPHIILEAKGGGRSLASAVPDRAQVLSLEGNFDDHFTLYCPKGYEQDALYLFTPDVMVELIDHARGFDVEIIDDWLFLESTRDIVTLDPETWHNAFAATSAIATKVERWARWRDTGIEATPFSLTTPTGSASLIPARGEPDAGTGQVAPAGRRLRMLGGRVGILAGIFAVVLTLALLYAVSI